MQSPFIDSHVHIFDPKQFLKAPARIDYGPLLTLLEELVPDDVARHAIQWETPKRLFGF